MIVDQLEVKTKKIWPYKRHKLFEDELRRAAANWFSSKEYPTHAKMPYCLERHDQWHKNIICNNVADHIQREYEINKSKKPFPLHKYVHHGLSSQAMLFNLLGPLVVKKDFKPLERVFNEEKITWPDGAIEAVFEYENRKVFKEEVGQPTSIDLKISGGNINLFIEAKLAEKEFGGCSIFRNGDCEGMNPGKNGLNSCYLHMIGRTYWKRLEKYNFNEGVFKDNPICPLAVYYQFFRELLFAICEGGIFVLLHDDRNPAFVRRAKSGEPDRGLWPFLKQFVPKRWRSKLVRITVQQVVSAIEDSGRHQNWINDFKEKYGLADL